MSTTPEASRAERRAALPRAQPRNPLRPLETVTPEQIEQLHRASLRILEDVGVEFQDAETLSLWEQAGAAVDHGAQRVRLDRGLVLELVAKAPRTFTWRARQPAHSLQIGGDALAFGPCGGMVYVSDLERGRRVGTLADYEAFVKLAHLIPALHFAAWGQVEPADLPVSVRHLYRLRSAFLLSDKPVSEAAHGREITADCVAMARLVFGDGAAFGTELESATGPAASASLGAHGDAQSASLKPPACPAATIGDVINVSSPLRFDQRMLGGLLTYARAGQATYITPFILAGAMSPITLAAALAQQNAEALAGVALTQLARPGAPVLMGGFTTNTDMRSGSPAFGTPEGAWALSVGAQLARYYGLPYRGSGALTNANVPDAQSAYESLWTLWPAVLSGAHLIMHGAGWLEAGLTASFEKFILDAENLAMFQHFLEGFNVTDETLALDMSAAVGAGGPTQARFASESLRTTAADRLGYEAWAAAGSWDAPRRAQQVWQDLLNRYEPPALDPAIREALDDYVARRERELAGKNLYE